MRRGTFQRQLGCAALLAALACAGVGRDRVSPPEAAAPAPRPAFWHAHAPGQGDFYLLGSVHVGEVGTDVLGVGVEQAYERSRELVVEVDVSHVTQADVEYHTERYATLPSHLTLDSLLSDDTRERLARYVASRRLKPEVIQRFKPWFVSQLIMMAELRSIGFDAAFGVDRLLIEQANGRKPIVGLETIASQFETLDAQPLALQELMLKDVLERIDDLPAHTRTLLDAWAHGDESALEHEILESLEEHPELSSFYETFWWQRNRAMAARLVELAGDGDTRFVTLGAGHMVGEKGIPALLAAQGFIVDRIDPRAPLTGPDPSVPTN